MRHMREHGSPACPSAASEVRQLLPFLPADAFALHTGAMAEDDQSFLRDRRFLQCLVRSTQPRIIVEVGSWKGHSAIELGTAARTQGGCVVCVDTWLGSAEHWALPQLRRHLGLERGLPTLYRRFVSNVIAAGLQEVIIPMPMTSDVAARLLREAGVRADAVLLDGSHEPEQVTRDLASYSALLSADGVLFGDDFDWPEVRDAVESFANRCGLGVHVVGAWWVLGLDGTRFNRLFALYAT